MPTRRNGPVSSNVRALRVLVSHVITHGNVRLEFLSARRADRLLHRPHFAFKVAARSVNTRHPLVITHHLVYRVFAHLAFPLAKAIC